MSSAGWRVGQQGIASLVATTVGPHGRTALTRVVHRSPARLLPMRTPAAEQAGAAWCALGSHGGGLVGGDSLEIDVTVAAGATLAMTSQSSSKVYRTRGARTETRLLASVAPGGLLVLAPDPIVPFRASKFEQLVAVELAPGGSAVVVDWIGAGRVSNGERWAFAYLWSRTDLHLAAADGGGAAPTAARLALPAVSEAVCMDRPSEREADGRAGAREFGFDLGGSPRFSAIATVLVAGERADGVAAALRYAALQSAARHARVRKPRGAEVGEAPEGGGADGPYAAIDRALAALRSELHIGVSDATHAHERDTGGESPASARASPPVTRVTVARFVARAGEDVTRLLHACLAPLDAQLGGQPYADRLHGAATAEAPPAAAPPAPLAPASPAVAQALEPPPPTPAPVLARGALLSGAAQWQLCALIDSGLPTGGFAHSSGLEAARQLLLRPTASLGGSRAPSGSAERERALAQVLGASARSSARLQSAFAHAAHAALSAAHARGAACGGRGEHAAAALAQIDAELLAEFDRLDAALGALLAGHAPACRASREHGAALARLAARWLGADGEVAADAADARAVVDHTPSARGRLLLARLHGRASAPREPGVAPRGGHGATVFGALAAALEIPAEAAVRALAFTSARGALSAAVRLDLVGPLHAVTLMAGLERAADDGVRAAASAAREALARAGHAPAADAEWELADALVCSAAARLASVRFSATSAPALDAVHAAHDLLEMRLFQT